MQTKYIFQGFGVLILASAAWHYVGADMVRAARQPPPKPAAVVKFQNDAPIAEAAPAIVPFSSAPKNIPMPAGGARKCRRGSTVFYTDRECPSGAKEHEIGGGSITVVKGQRPSPSSLQDAPRPTVRDMLGTPDDGKLREKQIDRIVNR